MILFWLSVSSFFVGVGMPKTPPGAPAQVCALTRQKANSIDPVGDPVPGETSWTVAVKLRGWLAITDPGKPEIVVLVSDLSICWVNVAVGAL